MIRAATFSITAATFFTAAFVSGYRIGYDKRRQEIFDIECELRMYGHLVDSVYCGICDIKDILSCQEDKYLFHHGFD